MGSRIGRQLRIAQLAPLAEAVPPKLYGGTERVVSYLTEALVARGHDVTLFASGDSQTSARLVACTERALRLRAETGEPIDPAAHLSVQLRRILERARHFDVIHSHLDHAFFPLVGLTGVPTVTTMHGRLDAPELRCAYEAFDDVALVSISHAQRRPLPDATWVANVYHGLPRSHIDWSPSPATGDDAYVAFVGRFSPEKRAEMAIRVALDAGLRIKLAAKIDVTNQDYFRAVIAPLLDHPRVEYVGEVDDAGKPALLGGALALLFLIDWPEPFGLAMIEAMACGTPVIAMRRGSVPEVVDAGVTGFVVDDEATALDALRRIDRLDRRVVRETFERRFSVEQMADAYEQLYARMTAHHRPQAASTASR